MLTTCFMPPHLSPILPLLTQGYVPHDSSDYTDSGLASTTPASRAATHVTHRNLLRPAASTSKVNTHCFEAGLRDSQSVIRSLLLNTFQARRHRLVLPLCNTSLILF